MYLFMRGSCGLYLAGGAGVEVAPVFTTQKYAGGDLSPETLPEPPADVVVRIPKDLHDEITKSLGGKGFSTVDEFVVYVLRVNMGKPAEDLEKEDTKTVTDRLKRLGYI